jgi:dTDP-4-amino-4,6-dideoxygalactose transaminase
MIVVKFSDLTWQYHEIKKNLLNEIELVLESGIYTNGTNVKLLEKSYAEYCNQKFAVGVNSGTSALHAGMAAMGIGPGDEVIVPSHTFIASVNAILLTGATPVLVDIGKNGLLDSVSTLRSINKHTKAVMPVHLYGSLVSENLLKEICAMGVQVIEDASQAHGAKFPSGLSVGAYGKFTAFSFYPGKNLGAAGEAGIVTTDNEDLARKISNFRNWGAEIRYQHDSFGLNYRMDEIQAVIVKRKLDYLDHWNKLRNEIANFYTAEMDKLSIDVVNDQSESSVYHQYVISIADRNALQRYLQINGIETLIHYPIPVHKQSAVEGKFKSYGTLKNTEVLTERILSLPIYPGLELEKAKLVVDKISEFYDK